MITLFQEIQNEKVVHPQKEKMDKIFSWVEENGGECPHLKVKWFSDDNRTLVAGKNLAKNEKIASIPENIILTLEVAQKGEIG